MNTHAHTFNIPAYNRAHGTGRDGKSLAISSLLIIFPAKAKSFYGVTFQTAAIALHFSCVAMSLLQNRANKSTRPSRGLYPKRKKGKKKEIARKDLA